MARQTHTSCVDLLLAMVGFDTVNANISGKPDPERKLAEYLDMEATSRGFTTQRLPVSGEGFNLLVSHEVAAEAPWLLFESHLDTVSVQDMTIDPFVGRIDGNRIYGRGACDTKASGAAMLTALVNYAAATDRSNNVAILYTLDEEIFKTGVVHFVKHDLPELTWSPFGVIVGEPTELEPVVAHNGAVRWTIQTHGVSAHSSDPSRGRSAISMMAKVIQAIESQYIPNLTASHPLTGKAQCSINVIRGGVQINMIPEHCQLEIDRRTVPGEDIHAVLPAVEHLLDQLRQEDPNLQISQDEPFLDPPLDPSGSEAFVGFVQSLLGQMHLPSQLRGVGYGTDAGNFSLADVPTTILGPGNIAQAHTCDEWLELEQLDRAVDVYLNLMRYRWPGK